MFHAIDTHKLNTLNGKPLNYASPAELRRVGRVFFIGGDLPVYSTLETMYESYCLEATDLFHVTFGNADAFEHNLDMVRQIKRNFSIRLMGQIGFPLSAVQIEQVYLAGLDILDIPHHSVVDPEEVRDAVRQSFLDARHVFTRWSVVSTISTAQEVPEDMAAIIHDLLGQGVVPLLVIGGGEHDWDPAATGAIFLRLAAEWHLHRVSLKPVMPLLRLTTPFEISTTSGFLRGAFDKFQDRRIMAASDLRRHLRTAGAEASFESAGL